MDTRPPVAEYQQQQPRQPQQDTHPRQDAQLEELLALDAEPFDARRLKQQTFSKLGIDAQSKPRRLPRRFSVALVAAAIMVVAVPSAFAVSGIIANMGEDGIGFFGAAGTADSTANKPVLYAAMQADLEKANAPIGLSLSFEGGSITLDTLAVDDNFINAFYTIRYDEPINKKALVPYLDDNTVSDWAGMWTLAPHISYLVDGAPVTAEPNGFGFGEYVADSYYVDERTVALMAHKVIAGELPDVFDLTITLPAGLVVADSSGLRSAEVAGSFAVTVDKSATSVLTRRVEPDVRASGSALGMASEVVIEELSFGPFGVVATVTASGFGLDFPFLVTDDRGNAASFFHVYGTPVIMVDLNEETAWIDTESMDRESAASVKRTYKVELLGLDPQAQSVTITPVNWEDPWPSSDSPQVLTYDVSQTGTRVPLSDVGGVTISGYEIKDGQVVIKAKPYGYIGPVGRETFNPALSDGLLYGTLNESRRVALANQYYDRTEDLIVSITDYYVATDEQLAQITDYRAIFEPGFSLDEPAARTLPLP